MKRRKPPALTLSQQCALRLLAEEEVIYEFDGMWGPRQTSLLSRPVASATINALQRRKLVHIATIRLDRRTRLRARLTTVGKALARALIEPAQPGREIA
jgi:hypothetical protein